MVLDRIGKYSINTVKRTKAYVILVPFFFVFCSYFFFIVVFCFNNIFWLKFGLLFTRPALLYLGPGPRGR